MTTTTAPAATLPATGAAAFFGPCELWTERGGERVATNCLAESLDSPTLLEARGTHTGASASPRNEKSRERRDPGHRVETLAAAGLGAAKSHRSRGG